ncbi:MAG: molecular chaperone TorD family protein [Actinomycetota bacterium]
MKRATGEERALARATMYRLLSLSFSYPTPDLFDALAPALQVGEVGADLLGEGTGRAATRMTSRLAETDQNGLEQSYMRVFTLSYSEDCPPYETAFSASHLFQQTRHQADIAGFYRAFGVHPRGDRPDHLSMELEFCYLLALRESRAREAGDKEAVSFCRNTERVFLREHLARWVPSIAGRISLAAKGGFHGAAASALSAFIEWEEGFLRLGKVERYRDEPWPVDPLEEFQCPLDEPGPVEDLLQVETSHASAHG